MIINRQYKQAVTIRLTHAEIDKIYHLIIRGTYSGAPGFMDTADAVTQLVAIADFIADED